ncbi:MAG: DUF397 domain-containing protein [Micromonosporaceae bacterium]
MAELPLVAWRISSRSGDGGGGSCVEAGPVLDGSGRVAVRHSKHREHGPVIVYTRDEWAAFVAGVKDGEFDLPA